MVRVVIVKEDEKGKRLFLFGGQDSTSCIEDVMRITSDKETLIAHFKDENELFNKLALFK